MKIALFSDIHANFPALQACLRELDAIKPDAVYCLGDLVGYNIWANEVVNEIRRRGIPTIAGNYDFGIGRNSDECGCAYKTDEEREMGEVSIGFTNGIIGDEERRYLRTLPAHINIEFQLSNDKLFLMLVHGSPRKINEYLFEDREEASLLRIMESANADILCFGHTHKPFHRVLQSGTADAPRYWHAINIGSVGKPKDGDPRGCFALLTIDEHASVSSHSSVSVSFIRFDYNVEEAACAVEQSPLPNAYAEMLRQGR